MPIYFIFRHFMNLRNLLQARDFQFLIIEDYRKTATLPIMKNDKYKTVVVDLEAALSYV